MVFKQLFVILVFFWEEVSASPSTPATLSGIERRLLVWMLAAFFGSVCLPLSPWYLVYKHNAQRPMHTPSQQGPWSGPLPGLPGTAVSMRSWDSRASSWHLLLCLSVAVTACLLPRRATGACSWVPSYGSGLCSSLEPITVTAAGTYPRSSC